MAIIDAEGDYGVVIVSGANLQIAKEDVRKSRDLIQHATVLVLENEILDARIFSPALNHFGRCGVWHDSVAFVHL